MSAERNSRWTGVERPYSQDDVERIRGRFRIESDEEVAGGRQATVAATIEREGSEKPVCVAELVFRRLA